MMCCIAIRRFFALLLLVLCRCGPRPTLP